MSRGEVVADFDPRAGEALVGFSASPAAGTDLEAVLHEVLGAVDVFLDDHVSLEQTAARLVHAVVDLASFALVQERALHRATDRAGQLQEALDARIVIEQAKGVLAERLKVDMDEAFGVLRRYSRSRSTRVSQVAANVVERRVSVDDLLDGGRGQRRRGRSSAAG